MKVYDKCIYYMKMVEWEQIENFFDIIIELLSVKIESITIVLLSIKFYLLSFNELISNLMKPEPLLLLWELFKT